VRSFFSRPSPRRSCPTAALFVLMAPIAVNSHPGNTLVMGPGGYRFLDYVRLGLPLTLLVFVIVVIILRAGRLVVVISTATGSTPRVNTLRRHIGLARRGVDRGRTISDLPDARRGRDDSSAGAPVGSLPQRNLHPTLAPTAKERSVCALALRTLSARGPALLGHPRSSALSRDPAWSRVVTGASLPSKRQA
jgi:hypothetical protein